MSSTWLTPSRSGYNQTPFKTCTCRTVIDKRTWTVSAPSNIIVKINNSFLETVPHIRQLATHFSPRRPGFNPTATHVIFFVHKQTQPQVYSSSILVCPLPVITAPNSNNHLLSRAGIIGPFETAVTRDSVSFQCRDYKKIITFKIYFSISNNLTHNKLLIICEYG